MPISCARIIHVKNNTRSNDIIVLLANKILNSIVFYKNFIIDTNKRTTISYLIGFQFNIYILIYELVYDYLNFFVYSLYYFTYI